SLYKNAAKRSIARDVGSNARRAANPAIGAAHRARLLRLGPSLYQISPQEEPRRSRRRTRKVEEFLTHLAVVGNVAPSTRNQALNALLFLYAHVLEQPLEQ